MYLHLFTYIHTYILTHLHTRGRMHVRRPVAASLSIGLRLRGIGDVCKQTTTAPAAPVGSLHQRSAVTGNLSSDKPEGRLSSVVRRTAHPPCAAAAAAAVASAAAACIHASSLCRRSSLATVLLLTPRPENRCAASSSPLPLRCPHPSSHPSATVHPSAPVKEMCGPAHAPSI